MDIISRHWEQLLPAGGCFRVQGRGGSTCEGKPVQAASGGDGRDGQERGDCSLREPGRSGHDDGKRLQPGREGNRRSSGMRGLSEEVRREATKTPSSAA